jgi:hypothetical protein
MNLESVNITKVGTHYPILSKGRGVMVAEGSFKMDATR